MVTTRTFLKDVPSTQTSLLRWISPPSSGALITLHSKSTSSLTYRFEESSDGSTWTTKSFLVGEATVTSFTLEAGAMATLKVTSTSQLRLSVLGTDGSLLISIAQPTDEAADAETVIHPYPY